MRLKDFQLLIFDWDGTLIDSASKIVDCLVAAIAAAGLPSKSPAELKYIIGLSMQSAIHTLYPEGINEEQARVLVQTYQRQFMQDSQVPMPLFKGVKELLIKLREEGFNLAIATGKSRKGLDVVLREYNMQEYFDVTCCADESQSKPNPAMLHQILADLDLTAENAIMIGDTHFDIEMAHNAKMSAIAVSSGAHSLVDLSRAEPKLILEDVTNLLSYLH